MSKGRRLKFAVVVGLGVATVAGLSAAIWRNIASRGGNVIVIPEATATDPIIPVATVRAPLQLPACPVANEIEEVRAPAPPPAFDLEGLPGPAFSSLVRNLPDDNEGKASLGSVKLTCKRLYREANNTVTHLRSEHFVVDNARLAQIPNFDSVESLELKLGVYTPSLLIAALNASRHLTDLYLAGVGDATALCDCLSSKTLLRTLGLEDSVLPSLDFVSTLASLVSFSLMESSSLQPNFGNWNDLSSLARLSIDTSDGIANANMTSLSSIPGLEYLHVGLKDFDEESLLTLNQSDAKLSLKFYTMKNIEKLPVLEHLLKLERLSFIYFDLHRLSFPLNHLTYLKHFHISTQCFENENFESLDELTEQLQSLELELTSVPMEIVKCLCTSDLPLVSLKLHTDFFELESPLNNCPYLKTLHVSATGEVSGKVFSYLGYFSQLENLVLTQCLTSTEGIEDLHISCPRLKSFSIGACPMTDQDLEYISRISTLERLELLCCFRLTTIAPLNLLQSLRRLRIELCFNLERNLEDVLSEPIVTRLESLQMSFSAKHDPCRYAHLFDDLKKKSSCLVLETEVAPH